MLNLRSPGADHIFHASGLMGRVMERGQTMSVSPSSVRTELLNECLPLFEKMRDLARAHFAKDLPFLLSAIDEYEAAIRSLAGLGGGQIIEDRRDGEGHCPACGTPITKFCTDPKSKSPNKVWIILCGKCGEPFMAAYHKLDSSEGFGTWGI